MKPNLIKGEFSRRSFLAGASTAVALPMIFNGIPLHAFEGEDLNRLLNIEADTDRVLVLVQLSGGNDGLNTVIPLDSYSTYKQLRSNIAIPEASVLKIREDAGLHPSMTGIKSLWDENKVNIVQGVAYPNSNLSHFRSTDIWMSGSDSDKVETTGWLGRYLDRQYPNYPSGYPTSSMPDPIAIQMSAVVGLMLTGYQRQTMGVALQDPETFYRLVSGSDAPGSDLPTTPSAIANVKYVREVQLKSMQYSTVIKAAADKAQNMEQYPTPNRLADQLKIVARLIAGGLKTRVYVVQLLGFDTHAAQTDATDTTIGSHAGLLKLASDAITAFQRDIEKLGAGERVVTMTFSEFGRRASSNLSLGTDHGSAAPMFVFGLPVQDGIVGSSPDLLNLDKDNLRMQYDFRQVYSSILQQWFGADATTVSATLFGDFSTVKVIRSSPTSVNESEVASGMNFTSISPNPARDVANISFNITEELHVRLDVFDALGLHVATVCDGMYSAGPHQHAFNVQSLPSGSYVIQLRSGNNRVTRSMVVTR